MFTATVPIPAGASTEFSRAEGRIATDVADLLVNTDEGCGLPCRTHDPDLWFSDAPSELERAKQYCADCPLRAQCLSGALDRHEPWGVWGGEIFDRGVVIARKRPRGRPRKHDRPEVAA